MEIAYDNELTHHPPEVNNNIELENQIEIGILLTYNYKIFHMHFIYLLSHNRDVARISTKCFYICLDPSQCSNLNIKF